MKAIHLLAGILFLPQLSMAGTSSYQCQIKEHMMINADGSLKRPSIPYLLNQRFAVDRRTGKFTGPDAGFAFEGPGYKVLATGNDKNSFISTFTGVAAGDGVHFVVIRVEEFAKEKLKPFSVLDGGTIATGTCE